MNIETSVERIFDYLENDHVEKATMLCLRVARNLKDYLFIAVFLRDMQPNNGEFMRIVYDDISHLNNEMQNKIVDLSDRYWFETHTLDFSLGKDEKGRDLNILAVGIADIEKEIENNEKIIEDYKVPTGMGPLDTAVFTDKYVNFKTQLRLRTKGLNRIKSLIKNRCLNYAIKIELQIQNQQKTKSFLLETQNTVDNYFKIQNEDIFNKLNKALKLVDSKDTEDLSLLLTEVRRCIKSVADHFYPPRDGTIKCADGKERKMTDENYLNRLNEYLVTKFEKSSARDLLKSEYDYLSVFTRRLNDIASKGVHSDITIIEAKQALLGLYMFLYNIVSRLMDCKID